MIQEAAHLVSEATKTVDSFVFWEITSGITAFVGYVIWNERYQHRQDLALLKLESDRDNHSESIDDNERKIDEIVRIVTSIDRVVRRIADKNGIRMREDD